MIHVPILYGNSTHSVQKETLIKGKPFDSKFVSMILAGKVIFRYTKAEILIFTHNKKLGKKKNTGKGVLNVGSEGKQDRIFP